MWPHQCTSLPRHNLRLSGASQPHHEGSGARLCCPPSPRLRHKHEQSVAACVCLLGAEPWRCYSLPEPQRGRPQSYCWHSAISACGAVQHSVSRCAAGAADPGLPYPGDALPHRSVVPASHTPRSMPRPCTAVLLCNTALRPVPQPTPPRTSTRRVLCPFARLACSLSLRSCLQGQGGKAGQGRAAGTRSSSSSTSSSSSSSSSREHAPHVAVRPQATARWRRGASPLAGQLRAAHSLFQELVHTHGLRVRRGSREGDVRGKIKGMAAGRAAMAGMHRRSRHRHAAATPWPLPHMPCWACPWAQGACRHGGHRRPRPRPFCRRAWQSAQVGEGPHLPGLAASAARCAARPAAGAVCSPQPAHLRRRHVHTVISAVPYRHACDDPCLLPAVPHRPPGDQHTLLVLAAVAACCAHCPHMPPLPLSSAITEAPTSCPALRSATTTHPTPCNSLRALLELRRHAADVPLPCRLPTLVSEAVG